MVLNHFGIIAQNEWYKLPDRFPNLQLGAFQVMPNHIHVIIILNETNEGATLAVAPINDENAVAPINDENAVAPLNDENAVAPINDENAVAPMNDVDAGAPINNVDSVAPMNDENAVASMNNVDAVAPMNDENAIAQIHGGQTVTPMIDKNIGAGVFDSNNGAIGAGVFDSDIGAIGAGASPAPAGTSSNPTVGNIIGAYKSLVANECLKIFKADNRKMGKLWQRNYYERIIWNHKSYQIIANYIINNPAKWNDDKFFTGS